MSPPSTDQGKNPPEGKPPKRSYYLEDIPLDKAWERFSHSLIRADLWDPLEAEVIPLHQATGRVTAGPIWAETSSPHYHSAAMDGYAIHSDSTSGASDRSPVVLPLGSQAVYVDTGDPIPEWSNAVLPIEIVEQIESTEANQPGAAIRCFVSVAPWSHVRMVGEDMVMTELVIPGGTVLRPVDIGAIAASGHSEVRVWRKPRIAILPTGTELVPPGSTLQPGDIVEFNSLVLAAQIEQWGGVAKICPSVPDDFDEIRNSLLLHMHGQDALLVIAGSSAGSEDFTAQVISSLGELLLHGIAVRPGHPVILGMLQPENGKLNEDDIADDKQMGLPVIGVPGYPVSAALTGEIFVEPLLARWTGRQPIARERISAKLTRKVRSSPGDLEFLRVSVGKVGGTYVATPLSRGAGLINSLVRADGIVEIPAGIQGLSAGETVAVQLYRPLAKIERTILILGSHDLTIDLMAQHLASAGLRISSANLGSIGGLIALGRGDSHIAGSHLLDPESGEFNLSYIEEYLPGQGVAVIGLANRQQGLVISPGNPKGIQGLEDLKREDIRYVNRQRGAGTRILLDYHLKQLSLSGDDIRGYEQEEFTHLMVAAAVASGRADCGLAINAAATALELDFIPLFEERYDLIIPLEHYRDPMLQPLLELLADREFRSAVDQISGYSAQPMGVEIAVLNPTA